MKLEPVQNGNGAKAKILNLPSIRFVKADQKQVMDIWPKVREGCLAIKRDIAREAEKRGFHGGDEGNWTPEHVRGLIDAGFVGRSTAELWLMCTREDKVAGFAVTLISNCPYNQAPISLTIWLAYTFQRLRGADARKLLAEMEQYGRNRGLKHMDGYSFNPKWDAYLRRYSSGYRAAQIMLRKDLWE